MRLVLRQLHHQGGSLRFALVITLIDQGEERMQGTLLYYVICKLRGIRERRQGHCSLGPALRAALAQQGHERWKGTRCEYRDLLLDASAGYGCQGQGSHSLAQSLALLLIASTPDLGRRSPAFWNPAWLHKVNEKRDGALGDDLGGADIGAGHLGKSTCCHRNGPRSGQAVSNDADKRWHCPYGHHGQAGLLSGHREGMQCLSSVLLAFKLSTFQQSNQRRERPRRQDGGPLRGLSAR
mmetsp:Transcript_65368/g.142478  ORF Transcript_65368/g.142478 Transcript_65368/m.142478 type:complete len:238 (+) Transcript_65368:276-989(+)